MDRSLKNTHWVMIANISSRCASMGPNRNLNTVSRENESPSQGQTDTNTHPIPYELPTEDMNPPLREKLEVKPELETKLKVESPC